VVGRVDHAAAKLRRPESGRGPGLNWLGIAELRGV